MKHAFPKRRLSTLTRGNVYRFIALWDGKESPSSYQIAQGIMGPAHSSLAPGTKALYIKDRHIRRVEQLRRSPSE